MVKYWGRGLLMLFEPFCQGSARFSNVFFSTPMFIALVSIYDSTLAVNGIIVLGSHREVFDGLSSFEMYMYPIFTACFLDSHWGLDDMEPPYTSSDCCCFLGPFAWLFFFVCFCWGFGSSVLFCLWPMWCIYISLVH